MQVTSGAVNNCDSAISNDDRHGRLRTHSVSDKWWPDLAKTTTGNSASPSLSTSNVTVRRDYSPETTRANWRRDSRKSRMATQERRRIGRNFYVQTEVTLSSDSRDDRKRNGRKRSPLTITSDAGLPN